MHVCSFAPEDSTWLARAMSNWTQVGEKLLRVESRPFPFLILFDDECVYQVNPGDRWHVTAEPHRGSVRLPNGRAIAPIGVAITSPTVHDTGVFLAIALPDAWRADPRYSAFETRSGWERYLVGAFAHEMTHARMLEYLLPRLRALEAAIYPDTVEDNAIQNRFGHDRDFAQSIRSETELLYRATVTPTTSTRMQHAREAQELMRARWNRYYVGDFQPWRELEQVFLDLEGVAQWVAFHVRYGPDVGVSRAPGSTFVRVLDRFRDAGEVWSEDQGLLLIFTLDALVPDWQRQLLKPRPPTAFELLSNAVSQGH